MGWYFCCHVDASFWTASGSLLVPGKSLEIHVIHIHVTEVNEGFCSGMDGRMYIRAHFEDLHWYAGIRIMSLYWNNQMWLDA